LNFLRILEPEGMTRINESLTEFTSICSNPGIVIIVSDLFDEKGLQDGLMALATRNFDTHLIHLLDHEEITWSEKGNLLLREMETGEEKQIYIDGALLELYREKVNRFISDIQAYCNNYGISYYLHDTAMAFEDFLLTYITRGTIFR
jgi:hypothetical protein